jgi:cytochrome c-type biogenesis protein CcmH
MKTRTSHFAFYLLFLLALLIPAGVVSAQQPTPSDDEVNAVARQLYCPVCENTPLDVCPTQACHDWRELIRQMLAEGKTPDEIKQYFVDHYGARVLSEPPRAGLNWLVYIVPPLVFLAGVYFLFRAFRTAQLNARGEAWRRLPKESVSEAGLGSALAAEDEYASRLEEELRLRKKE